MIQSDENCTKFQVFLWEIERVLKMSNDLPKNVIKV